MLFRNLPIAFMDIEEIEVELKYQSKRLYRLRKLERMGKSVEPVLSVVEEREAELDMGLRLRRRGKNEITQ